MLDTSVPTNEPIPTPPPVPEDTNTDAAGEAADFRENQNSNYNEKPVESEPPAEPEPIPAHASKKKESTRSDDSGWGNDSWGYNSSPSVGGWDNEPPKPVRKKKANLNWLVYLTPFFVILLYIAVYVIVIPILFGKGVSFIQWLFSGPDDILEHLKTPDWIIAPVAVIIGLKVFNWIISVAFWFSLFFVGRTLQKGPSKVSVDATLAGKEAYLLAQEIYESAKLISAKEAGAAKNAIRGVAERLRNESDFGTGSSATITCENEIASALQGIQSALPGLSKSETLPGSSQKILALCQKIQSGLNRRIELKKR